mmetsp:Transcript_18386/g.47094  ORF Transcript_18386/g.47094 Transcript_18386/m.47094 type:complete len:211 (+) Transcript_18386:501-1133(+)
MVGRFVQLLAPLGVDGAERRLVKHVRRVQQMRPLLVLPVCGIQHPVGGVQHRQPALPGVARRLRRRGAALPNGAAGQEELGVAPAAASHAHEIGGRYRAPKKEVVVPVEEDVGQPGDLVQELLHHVGGEGGGGVLWQKGVLIDDTHPWMGHVEPGRVVPGCDQEDCALVPGHVPLYGAQGVAQLPIVTVPRSADVLTPAVLHPQLSVLRV